MSCPTHTDPATLYDDSPFPGRLLLSLTIVLWLAAAALMPCIEHLNPVPTWMQPLQVGLMALSVPLYFIGFWMAITGKGYVKVLFLISLVPPLGLLILFFLPPLRKPIREENVIDLD